MKPKRFYFRTTAIFGTPLKYGAPLFIGFTVFISGLDAQAGDILRGGSAGTNKPGRAAAGTPTPAATDAARANAKDTLARTTRTLDAVRAMQAAARNAALKNGTNNLGKNPNNLTVTLPRVPNGLLTGGLQVAPAVATDPTKWTGAKLPTQTVKNGKTQVTIQQTDQQALLNWQSFNVGKKTTVTFDQSKGGADVGKWIAFNKITDPTGNPTQILGTIKAAGQVYLINPNGIIFGGSSQVNVHTLTASSLAINDTLVARGLLNNPDQQFLFSALNAGLSADGKAGDVTVQKGARITAPTSAAKVGGRVALIGANVSNEGTIKTPDGQTILAAGLQVGFAAHDTGDASLRGLDTYVGAVVDPASTLAPYAGTVVNDGIIDAARANVTLVGKTVNQSGVINSTTSVSLNGRIDLLASYGAIGNIAFDPSNSSNGPSFLNQFTGSVTLGEGSVTRILPELDSKEKIIGTRLALSSEFNATGNLVHFDDNAVLLAPNANVTVNAGTWLTKPSTTADSPPTYQFLRSGGRIDLDAGAVIDVAGSINVKSSVTSNIVEVQLRGTELANSPLLRDGVLRGETIFVDITKTGTYNGKTWVGSPIADVSGYANLVERTVGELTTAGGTVKLNAGDAVCVRDGAVIDVSSGSVNYKGGVIETSRVTAGGKIFDISEATPDQIYDGIYGANFTVTNAKWNVTQTFDNVIPLSGKRYQEGFWQGGAGGHLAIKSAAMGLDGKLTGSVFTGPRQRDVPPAASSLSLSFTAEKLFGGLPVEYSPSAPGITFSRNPDLTKIADFAVDANGVPVALAPERNERVVISPGISGSTGFGSLAIYNPDGNITVGENVTLDAGSKGAIDFAAANLTVEGAVIARGGSISLTTYNQSPSLIAELSSGTDIPPAAADRGLFKLGAGGVLDVAGNISDDRPLAKHRPSATVVTAGGKVAITSYSADLAAGSTIDASGGVYLSGTGKATYGAGGAISILSGRDPNLASVTGGVLKLGGELRGYSGAAGGSLTLLAEAVAIGGNAPDRTATLGLRPGFFNQGGFSKFDVSGIGYVENGKTIPGLMIAAGTHLKPRVSGLVATGVAGGGDIGLVPTLKPLGLRSPVTLSFSSLGIINGFTQVLEVRGDTFVGAGSVIDAGPRGAITLAGNTVELHGELRSNGGTIRVSGAGKLPSTAELTSAYTTVLLGADAMLDASGAKLLVPDPYGRSRGVVLDGGTIRVSGNVVAEAGSVLDVSGASGTLDLLAGETGKSLDSLHDATSGTVTQPYATSGSPTRVESNGGTITFAGGQMLWSDATLIGKSGGDTAAGGTLQLSSGKFVPVGVTVTPLDPTLVVRSSGSVLPKDYVGSIGGETPVDSTGIVGGGRFAASRFDAGGFANLDLTGTIRFSGRVSIEAAGRITAGNSPVLLADSVVSLNASYISLGRTFQNPLSEDEAADFQLVSFNGTPFFMPPTHGQATLRVSAGLIDVGYLSLGGIGKLDLTAKQGDVRGSGTLAVAGDIRVHAGQVYAPTDLNFTIAASDYQNGTALQQGSVTIQASGTRTLPLSAGSSLNVYGSIIRQNGVLRAPFGTITLGWDGSGDVPHDDQLSGMDFAKTTELVLGQNSVTSVSAIDPLTGEGVVIPYGVSFNGTNWIDPRGEDITTGGIPQKSVKLAAESVVSKQGSEVDIRGGGDLLAYRWVNGLGGTNDILASNGSFAVIPGYDEKFAPYAPFNPSLGSTAGYTNPTLRTGEQVRLDGGGLPAGVYTLLPARYALLPGAFLVTPQAGTAVGSVRVPDGSSVVSGYRFSGMNRDMEVPDLATRFEIAPAKTVAARAEYTELLANTFLTRTGGDRLPGDSGQLVLAATRAMELGGEVLSTATGHFSGGMIDISSPVDIFISGSASSAPKGALALDPTLLSSFGAESLLIGGIRSADSEGTRVTVTTGNLTLDNAGAPLTGSEVMLVANGDLKLSKGAELEQSGKLGSPAATLVFGDIATPGSGNAALVRVSSDPDASLIRHGVAIGGSSGLSIGKNVKIAGSSVTLDSTALSFLDSSATIEADALSLGSGRISLLLDKTIAPGADSGLVLTGSAIDAFSSAKSLSLTSYSSIDLLGAGTVGGLDSSGTPLIDSLSLHTAEIRGLGVGSGDVGFNAGTILLDNQPGGTAGSALSKNGSLSFHAEAIHLGQGDVAIRGFSTAGFDAAKELVSVATGSLTTSGKLGIDTPVVFAAQAVTYAISAGGSLAVTGDGSRTGVVSGAGLGSSLSFAGDEIDVSSRIVVPSGSLTFHATGGDLTVGGSLEAGGVGRRFKDQTRYTDGGRISLKSDLGDVVLTAKGSLDLAARPGGGDAGLLDLAATQGVVRLLGSIAGQAGLDGTSGRFQLDVGTLTNLAGLDGLLNAASFNGSRSFRVRNGDVVIDGHAETASYALSADAGAIHLTGSIDASGARGGSVRLVANQGLEVEGGSLIDVSSRDFDAAGKGGAVVLESRGANAGVLQLDAGSSIQLGVADATQTSAAAGKFTGTLHLRAPRLGTGGGNEIAIGTLESTISGASNIIVEGYKTYELTTASGIITTALQTSVKTEATAFIGKAANIESRILANQGGTTGGLGALLTVRPGVEIINKTGDLTLGTATTSGNNGNWNLATFRFGSEQVPGVLTLRAAGNLVFFNALSDGFTTTAYTSGLLARNNLLPDNAQAWSYRLVSGADFSAADSRRVKDLSLLGTDSGSLKLGKNGFAAVVTGGNNALTSTPLSPTSTSGLFQVIRTGSGDIDVVAGRDLQLLNNFASIYTAGTLVADPTLGGTFDTPKPNMSGSLVGSLGANQQPTPAPVQYTIGGGNISLFAGNDIVHRTRTALGEMIADSSRQMPVNWLYRRGFVDPASGLSGVSKFGESASTTWWVDFTNFFEGIGALGGGNVVLHAGRDVSNVDAVSVTNARMPKGAPVANNLVELGGGDVTVLAGRNIDAGTYYVERGHGTLTAGASITTNSTRSPSLVNLKSPAAILDPSTWLATTLFAGKASFDVSAGNDVLLGPVANPFLLPQGYNNTYWYKTYFSTYSPDTALSVSSLGGEVILREGTSTSSGVAPSLQTWFDNELRLTTSSASLFQPWLRLGESQVAPLATGFSLMPGNLAVTAFTGGISLVGNLTLAPAPNGSLDLLAAGSIGGLQISGMSNIGGLDFTIWSSSTINLSDADPRSIPGVSTPHAVQATAGTLVVANRDTSNGVFNFLTPLFAETGSTDGASQSKQLLHTAGLLHTGDSEPVRIYSDLDISDVELFSAKPARILAGNDIRDISFYIQNISSDSVSLVSAGRDLTAYDTATGALVSSLAAGNLRADGGSGPRGGDIQISGPGTLEVLAGNNLDLGIGGNNPDGTGNGITSIGNGRNPYLRFGGASVIAGAGIGGADSLESSNADFAAFIAEFVESGSGASHLKELGLTRKEFAAFDSEMKDRIALDIFYLVLRDAGRDHNNPDLPGFGNYDAGDRAIATLFPGDAWSGNIDTRARDIRTKNGGDISLFAPGGSVTLASTTIGNPLAPPGIVTEAGGNINVFTDQNVDLGISRIFTLKGGDEIIWSSNGNIAAGSSSKTVQSAPPTRVLIDPGSADVKTDLAGLATGGGIGVLASVAGVNPGDVDLIAPVGTIDAGDAGIRVSGNLNISAAIVVNSGNISVGGSSAGSAPTTASAPSVGSISAAANTAGAATAAVTAVARQEPAAAPPPVEETLSIISVEVIGYGGGTDSDEEEQDKPAE